MPIVSPLPAWEGFQIVFGLGLGPRLRVGSLGFICFGFHDNNPSFVVTVTGRRRYAFNGFRPPNGEVTSPLQIRPFIPLLPARGRRLRAASNPVGQGAPRQSGCQPSRNRRRSDPAIPGRRAGRCRWGIRRWRWYLAAPLATAASTPAPPTD